MFHAFVERFDMIIRNFENLFGFSSKLVDSFRCRVVRDGRSILLVRGRRVVRCWLVALLACYAS